MAHLSPKKGGFPFKDQHDRTCPVDPSKYEDYKSTLQRGAVLYVDSEGYFQVATKAADAANGPLYLSLQDFDDLQATMAGFFSAAKGNRDEHTLVGKDGNYIGGVPTRHKVAGHDALNFNTPSVTGIHMDDGDVWQTDMFDPNVQDWQIGDKLTTGANGKVTKATGTDTVIGYVTAVPKSRYVNDAVAVPGLMTGASRLVIEFQCGK